QQPDAARPVHRERRPRAPAARRARGGDLARPLGPLIPRKEHHGMNTSGNRSWALFGPVAVGLWIVGILLLTHNAPPSNPTGGDILAWYRSETNTILLGGWLFMVGCLSFVIFVSGVRPRIAAAAGPGSQLPGLALAGAAMGGVFGMLMAAADVA